MHYLHDRKLSPKAEELLQFDMDSIRMIVAAEHRDPPAVWLANPDQYEHNGRVLRDSAWTACAVTHTGVCELERE